MIKEANISKNQQYRYTLTRIWEPMKPKVAFVMLNPSTADANEDDNTVRKCMKFAKSWGFGGIEVVNLFPYRSTDPNALLSASDPFGSDNEGWVETVAESCDMVVCAWGNHNLVKKLLKGTSYNPLKGVKPTYCIELSVKGTPKHPLYLNPKLKPVKFDAEEYFKV